MRVKVCTLAKFGVRKEYKKGHGLVMLWDLHLEEALVRVHQH